MSIALQNFGEYLSYSNYIIKYYIILNFIKTLCFLFVKWIFQGHGLKYQTTLFPNGTVARVFGSSGSHNDDGVLYLSLRNSGADLIPSFFLPGGLFPTLYGDAVFQNVDHMTIITHYNLVGTIEEIQFLRSRLNYLMSGVQ